MFRMPHRPLLDHVEHFIEVLEARRRGSKGGIIGQLRTANQSTQSRPNLWLDNHVTIIVGPARPAAQCRARLSTARGIAGPWHCITKLAVGIFSQGAALKTLLVAYFDAAKVEHRVLHRNFDALPAASMSALIQCGQNTRDGVNAAAGIADLRAGAGRRTIFKTSGAHSSAHRLRDSLICFTVQVGSGTKTFD